MTRIQLSRKEAEGHCFCGYCGRMLSRLENVYTEYDTNTGMPVIRPVIELTCPEWWISDAWPHDVFFYYTEEES